MLFASVIAVTVLGIIATWLIRRNAVLSEQLREASKDVKVKNAQLKEAAKPKPSRSDVVKRMRSGKL
tara:strand:- start:61 stop:261 length:201 start_codon:yes stop_codon:yes gene_type:complete